MLTLQNLIDKGFKNAQELANRIFLINDFLSDEEIDQLMDIAQSATQEDWEGHYLSNMEDFCEQKFGRRDIKNLVAEGKLELTDNWNDKILSITNQPVVTQINKKMNLIFEGIDNIKNGNCVGIIQRQYDGTALTEHVDNHTDPSLLYACVAYVNDNYEGGEVFFSKFKISMKPKAGALLIFPTSEDWSHGVTEVTNGPTRYVLPIFIAQDGFYEANRY